MIEQVELSSGGKYTCYEAATPSAVSTINLVVMPKLQWINAKNMAYLVLGTPNAYIDASNAVGPTSITYTWSIDPENGTSFGNNTHMGYQYSVNHEFNQHQNTMRNNSQTDANAATNSDQQNYNSQQYPMNQHSLANGAVHSNLSHYNSQQQSISRNSRFYEYAPGNRNHSRVRRHAFKYEQITSSGSQTGAHSLIHSAIGFGPRYRSYKWLKLYAF